MFKKSKGATSTILLILGAVLILIIIVVFVVVRTTAVKNASKAKTPTTTVNQTPEPPKPVYDTTLGDIKYIIESATDLGDVMVTRNAMYPQTLTTTEKFIQVLIGAQNEGKLNTNREEWQIGNIVDADGRNFVSIDDRAYSFLPSPNLCGELLKPQFDPVSCTKFYEVSKKSTVLKIEISYNPPNGKKLEAFLDLPVQ